MPPNKSPHPGQGSAQPEQPEQTYQQVPQGYKPEDGLPPVSAHTQAVNPAETDTDGHSNTFERPGGAHYQPGQFHAENYQRHPVAPPDFSTSGTGQVLPPEAPTPLHHMDQLNNPGQQGENPDGSTNAYDFFLDPAAAQKKSFVKAPGSMASRILMVIAGFAGLAMIGVFAASMLFSTPDNSQNLLAIANDQQEIIRVSDLGSKSLDDTNLQNFAVNTTVTTQTSHQQLVKYLSETGTKVDPKQLTQSKNPQTDTALEAAESANTFDSTFKGIMETTLKSYEAKLSQSIQAALTQQEKDVLQKQHDAVLLLMKQLNGPQQNFDTSSPSAE